MNRKAIIIAAVIVAVAIGAVALLRQAQPARSTSERPRVAQQPVPPAQQPPHSAERIPAHYEVPPVSLGPTLPPERFIGPTRDAYRVAREIPQILAQLPCYCHCDQSVGHKSLHSCFEDEHAASCAVCVGEALTAYKLQKEQGLTPAQMRERIIAEYSQQ